MQESRKWLNNKTKQKNDTVFPALYGKTIFRFKSQQIEPVNRKKHTAMSKQKYKEPRLDENEVPICEECGKSFDFLLSHVSQAHKISSKDYKKKYGLHPKKPVMSESNRQNRLDSRRAIADANKAHLKKAGAGTRFKKGNKVQSIRWTREKEAKEQPLSVNEMITKMSEKGGEKKKDYKNELTGKLITKK